MQHQNEGGSESLSPLLVSLLFIGELDGRWHLLEQGRMLEEPEFRSGTSLSPPEFDAWCEAAAAAGLINKNRGCLAPGERVPGPENRIKLIASWVEPMLLALKTGSMPLGGPLLPLERILETAVWYRRRKTFQDIFWPRVKQMLAGKTSPRLLDIGCGGGWLFREIASLDSRISGIGLDPDQARVLVAEEILSVLHLGDRFSVVQGHFPADIPNGRFDWIALHYVVHHLPGNLNQAAEVVRKHLKKDGFITFSEEVHHCDLEVPAIVGERAFNQLRESVQGTSNLRREEIHYFLSLLGLPAVEDRTNGQVFAFGFPGDSTSGVLGRKTISTGFT